jgi:hypothetical protein
VSKAVVNEEKNRAEKKIRWIDRKALDRLGFDMENQRPPAELGDEYGPYKRLGPSLLVAADY